MASNAPTPARAGIRRVLWWLLTLAIAVLAGAAMASLGLPLAWMLAPLLVIGAGSAAGLPLDFPRFARPSGQVVIGAAIGLYFTPEVSALVAELLPLMVLAGLGVILAGAAIARLLEPLAAIDRTTAFFASAPGGVADMAVLAAHYGGQAGPVALAQSIRILAVVATVPIAVSLSGAHGDAAFQPLALPFDPARLVVLLLAGAALGYLLARARLPNAWMLGALATGVAVALLELPLSAIPGPLINAGQVLLGTSLGLSFRAGQIRWLWRLVPASLLCTLLLTGLAALAAWGIGLVARLDVPTMVLALAPGGITEMGITAKVLGLGVPLVTAFHVIRIAIVVLMSPLLYRWLAQPKPPPSGGASTV